LVAFLLNNDIVISIPALFCTISSHLILALIMIITSGVFIG
jgi:hypothetical protein